MGLLKKEDFYNTFFQKDRISSLFTKILFKYDNSLFYSSKHKSVINDFKVNFISLFPQYLTPEVSICANQKVKRLNQENLFGFGILLDGVSDIDSYLNNNFKSSTRGPIKRKLKRLESCFNIQSKIFYGKITETEYNTIMSSLKNMLTNRFIQKNDSNEAFGKWENYLNTTLPLIKNKEASLFVMYSNEDIIGVSLNYHKNSILIGHIIAYNIDYSKFGLGNTIVYKLIDWSIKNGYSILDMGNGALDYKRIWSNFSYNYEYYIVYNKSIAPFIIGQLEILKIKIKNLLKKLKIISTFRRVKKILITRKKREQNAIKPIEFEDINVNSFNEENHIKIKNINFSSPALRRTIFNFTFKQQEHIDNIHVFKLDEKTFIIKGKKCIQKITIN